LISFAENPYRILGLNVTATKKELVSRAEELQTLIRLGQTQNPNDPFIWLGQIKLNYDLINKAVQKLCDLRSRLENALLWFWIIDKNDQTAIDLISNKNFSEAEFIWKTAASPSYHYIKNIATLKHCLSLTFLDESSVVNIVDSIKNWAIYLNKTKIESILNVLGIEDINFSLDDFETIVVTNLKYSLNYISNHFIKNNKTHLISNLYNSLTKLKLEEAYNLLSRNEYFLLDKLSDLKLSCIELITKKIDSLCEEFDVIDKSKGPDAIFQETHAFHNKIKPFYELLCKLKDQCLIQKYGDKISNIFINRAAYYGNQTIDWDESLKLISLAGPLSKTNPTKKRYEENYKTIIGNSISYNYSKFRLNYIEINSLYRKEDIYNETIEFYDEAQQYLNEAKEANNNELENYLSEDMAAIILKRGIYIANEYQDYALSIRLFNLAKPLIKSQELLDYYNKNSVILYQNQQYKKSKFKENFYGIIAFIIFIIIIGIIGSVCENKSDRHSSYTKPSDYNYSFASNSSYNSKLYNSNKQQLDALKASIEISKAKIKTLEFQLSNLDETLKSYDSRLKSLKQKIEKEEYLIKLGISLNSYSYESNINEYNALAKKFNDTLSQYKSISAEHKKLIEQTYKDIDEYNQLIRKR